jgi:hypothetical protein
VFLRIRGQRLNFDRERRYSKKLVTETAILESGCIFQEGEIEDIDSSTFYERRKHLREDPCLRIGYDSYEQRTNANCVFQMGLNE